MTLPGKIVKIGKNNPTAQRHKGSGFFLPLSLCLQALMSLSFSHYETSNFVTIQQHRICVVAPRGYKFRLSRQAAQLSYISLFMGTSTLRRLLSSSYGAAE